MGKYTIAIMEGDGIGPEIVSETLKVLKAVEKKIDSLEFEFSHLPVGLNSFEEFGSTLPVETLNRLQECDAGILGPVTTHIYDQEDPNMVNPSGYLRKRLDLYANIRPSKNLEGIDSKYKKVDLVVIRENTEGMYADRNLFSGTGEFMPDQDTIVSFRIVTRKASERLAKIGFELALSRRRSVSIIHKKNVLGKGCGMFVNSCYKVGENYKDVLINDFHIDAFAMYLVQKPEDYDIILTTNMFGDILSDLAAGLVGGLGVAPGLNLGDNFMIAQATHGSAPDIANQNMANPVSEILSSKLMLEWLGIRKQDNSAFQAANLIENAVESCLKAGIKTKDLGGIATTTQVGDAIASYVLNS